MSSIDLVLFRNALGKQVLQKSVNNSMNISNNDKVREIIIVRKKKLDPTVTVTSLVKSAENQSLRDSVNVVAKKPRLDNSADESTRSPTPLAVQRRNARERNRVRQVNDGFAALRKHIPEEVASAFESANCNRGTNKKLSKVETLRMAVEYIRNLETLLNIGHDKENGSRPSMEPFPSPASSSPRENSQERSYYLNSPALEDEDEDELDGPMLQTPQQQYVELPAVETFQLVATPNMYEEEDGGQPMTPASDFIQEEAHSHLLDGHFPFPNSAEQFTLIPEQSYVNESEIQNDYEVKYADIIHHQIQYENPGVLEAINPDLILTHEEYKFGEDDFEKQVYNEVDLKKELPDVQVTPEDREQFEETLKWWQEKTRQVRSVRNSCTN